VKRWLKHGQVEGTKGNNGVWRIAEGQQPPPSADRGRPQGHHRYSGNGAAQVQPGGSRGETLGQPQDDPSAAMADHLPELSEALAEAGNRLARAERDLAVSKREIELLREREEEHRQRVAEYVTELAAAKTERLQLQELLHQAMNRPSLLERLIRALRGARARD
jgi:chromosome segregation ATPase